MKSVCVHKAYIGSLTRVSVDNEYTNFGLNQDELWHNNYNE